MIQHYWANISATGQDAMIAVALILPVLLAGLLVRRGFATGPLVRGILWRYRWANAAFVLLIAISVGMGIGLISQERALREGTAKAAEKFDLIIAAPGSELTMMLASVFLQPTDAPLLDGFTYSQIASHDRITFAAPLAFGDSYEGAPVIGSTAAFVTHLGDGVIEGRNIGAPFEAVAGAAVRLDIGQEFVPAHGFGDSADTEAHEDVLKVVGKLPRTGSRWDHAIITPVETVWLVHGLADGHAPDKADPRIGPPFDADYFPGTPAVVVKPSSLAAAYALRSEFTRDAETMAFFPGAVLATLYRIIGDARQAVSVMIIVSQILVAASVLLGQFILTRLFKRQIALLRAVGAPRRFILATIWNYCTLLLVSGAVLGLGIGYAAAAAISRIVTARTDILVTAGIGWSEVHLVAGFVSIAGLLSFAPSLVALSKPALRELRS